MFDPFEFEHVELDKGGELWLKNIPWSRGFVVLKVIIQAGAMQDPVGLEGVAHFLEHALWLGNKLHSGEEIRRIAEELFLNKLSTSTGYHATVYEVTALKDDRDEYELANFLGNFIFCPVIPSEKFERERGVIIQEFLQEIKTIQFEPFWRRRNAILYHDHPLSRHFQVCGWFETIIKISRDDLLAFHNRYYGKANSKVVMAGDINLLEGAWLANEILNYAPEVPLLSRPEPPVDFYPPEVPRQEFSIKEFWRMEEIPKQPPEVRIIWILPSPQLIDFFPFLKSILNKKLFNKLRLEKTLTYGANIDYWMYPDISEFVIVLRAEARSEEMVIKSIFEVLESITQKDFESARNLWLKSLQLVDLSVEEIGNNAVLDILNYGRVINLKEKQDFFSLLEYPTFVDFLHRWFTHQRSFTMIIKP